MSSHECEFPSILHVKVSSDPNPLRGIKEKMNSLLKFNERPFTRNSNCLLWSHSSYYHIHLIQLMKTRWTTNAFSSHGRSLLRACLSTSKFCGLFLLSRKKIQTSPKLKAFPWNSINLAIFCTLTCGNSGHIKCKFFGLPRPSRSEFGYDQVVIIMEGIAFFTENQPHKPSLLQ